jgi:chemotaxis protein MotB
MSTIIGWRALVAAVAVPALLAGCVSKSKYDEALDQNASLQQEVQSQQAQLATQGEQISQQSAQIGRLQNAIKYTVNSDLLFPPGKWQMSASGKQLIAKLAKQLAPGQQNMVYVSGYTDNAPVGAALKRDGVGSNEVLSRKRAEDVKSFLASQGFSPRLLTAQGYGEGHPIASNDTPQGRSQNRRVELSLAPPA